MKKSFSLNFNSNININGKNVLSSKASDNQKLTAQQEYWLNRFLRDYSGKVFFLIILAIVGFVAIFFVAGDSNSSSNSSSTTIQIGR